MAILTPEQFGAVGNNVANDTTAWQALLAQAAASRRPIVASGQYYVPGGLELPGDHIHIEGMGTGSLRCEGKAGHAIHSVGRCHLSVKNFEVKVPRSNLRSDKFAILMEGGSDIRVDKVRTDGGTVGAWFLNCSDVKVTGCHVAWPKADGIHFGHGSSDCQAIGNTVEMAGDDAFSTTFYAGYGGRPSDIVFANNTVLGTIWGAGIAAYSADRVVITGNNITRTACAGISTADHDGEHSCDYLTITGNSIAFANSAEKIPLSYWSGTDPALDPAVTSMVHKSALVVGGSVATVKNNNISQVGCPSGDMRHGMAIHQGHNIDVSDNQFHGVSGYGIITAPGVHPIGAVRIRGNTFEAVEWAAIRCDTAIGGYLIIEDNSGGHGQWAGVFAEVQNAGQCAVVVRNNKSLMGRVCLDRGGNPNYTAYGNGAY